MEYGTEDSLQHHTDAQGVKQTVLLDKTNPRLVVHSRLVLFRGKSLGLAIDDSNEEKSVDYVATVTDGVVEVMEDPERTSTAKIEITSVNIPELLCRHVLGIDQLEGRYEVEYRDEGHQ